MQRKKWLNQRRKCEKAQPRIINFTGKVEDINVCKRRINKNRRAAITFRLSGEDLRSVAVLVPFEHRMRCFMELQNGVLINALLQRFSPDYRRSSDEYELLDFEFSPETAKKNT